jgi:exonuclease SbcC
VPRLDDRRAVAPVISQNLTEARVRLDFTVDGARYTAVRVVRATKAGATTKDARLQRGEEVLAGDAKEVTAAVSELLGLGFEHFTTCVSLPQGQFAEFLHAEPRNRQDLLIRLLELGLYDAVAGAARQRAAQARSAADVITGQIERLAGATPEAKAAAEARVAQLAALAERLATERPEVEELAARAADERDLADRVAQQVDLVDGVVAPDGVAELAASVATAAEARDRAARSEDDACAATTAAEARLAGLPTRSSLEAIRGDHAQRVELAATLERGEGAEAEAASALAEATEAEAGASRARDDAAAELERVRVELRAQALVPELAVGEPCPVCGHAVHELPDAHRPPDLAVAERACTAAATTADRAAQRRQEAASHHARVDEKLRRVGSDLAAVEGRLVGALDPDALDEQLGQVSAAETELDKARQAERDARAARRAAERRHGDLVAAERDGRRQFDQARDAVAALGPPVPDRIDLAADWRGLVAWAAERRPGLVEDAGNHRRRAERARTDGAARIGALLESCREAGVEPPAGAWPGEAVAAEHARAEESVRRIADQMSEAERLRDARRAATERQQVADSLAGHLAANRFEKWLLDEAVHQLVAGASGLLAELSGGAHALAVDSRSGGFLVIDHANASQARSARTLSGGETFLASLALALALADQLAGLAAAGSARLDALFIDEGFGTLDPDTLDVVAATLDELGARGRMVGIVTHVRELAERLPVRFEVRKVAGTASVERVEG